MSESWITELANDAKCCDTVESDMVVNVAELDSERMRKFLQRSWMRLMFEKAKKADDRIIHSRKRNRRPQQQARVPDPK